MLTWPYSETLPSACRILTQAPKPAVGPCVDHHAVGHRVDRGADRAGQVDAGVQGAPAVTEAGGEHALGGHDEQRPLQPCFALGALLGERRALGEFLAVQRDVGRRLDGDDLHAARGSRSAVDGGLLGGQHGSGGRLTGRLDRGIGRGGRGARGHRDDHHAALGGAGRLPAVLRRARQHVGDLGVDEPGLLGAFGVSSGGELGRVPRVAAVSGRRRHACHLVPGSAPPALRSRMRCARGSLRRPDRRTR